jgi:hypothetical protein
MEYKLVVKRINVPVSRSEIHTEVNTRDIIEDVQIQEIEGYKLVSHSTETKVTDIMSTIYFTLVFEKITT